MKKITSFKPKSDFRGIKHPKLAKKQTSQNLLKFSMHVRKFLLFPSQSLFFGQKRGRVNTKNTAKNQPRQI